MENLQELFKGLVTVPEDFDIELVFEDTRDSSRIVKVVYQDFNLVSRSNISVFAPEAELVQYENMLCKDCTNKWYKNGELNESVFVRKIDIDIPIHEPQAKHINNNNTILKLLMSLIDIDAELSVDGVLYFKASNFRIHRHKLSLSYDVIEPENNEIKVINIIKADAVLEIVDYLYVKAPNIEDVLRVVEPEIIVQNGGEYIKLSTGELPILSSTEVVKDLSLTTLNLVSRVVRDYENAYQALNAIKFGRYMREYINNNLISNYKPTASYAPYKGGKHAFDCRTTLEVADLNRYNSNRLYKKVMSNWESVDDYGLLNAYKDGNLVWDKSLQWFLDLFDNKEGGKRFIESSIKELPDEYYNVACSSYRIKALIYQQLRYDLYLAGVLLPLKFRAGIDGDLVKFNPREDLMYAYSNLK